MPALIDIVERLLREESEVLRKFVTEPRGVFETVDETIKVLRSNVQELKKRKLITALRG